MNHSTLRTMPAAARAVDRAVGEMRRGVAVIVLDDAGGRTLALPAETATPSSLAEFLAGMAEWATPALLVAPSRAANLDTGRADAGQTGSSGGIDVVAIGLRAARLDTVLLRSLADPTARQVDPRPLLSDAAAWVASGDTATLQASMMLASTLQASMMLAKLGRLLPAVLVAPAGPDAGAGGVLLEVEAADIRAYPQQTEEAMVQVAEARVPLAEAEDVRVVAFRPADGGIEHLAILVGNPELLASSGAAPLVRVHSECFTGDLLGSRRCDCGPQLHQALRRMAAEGAGVLLYMAQEGRGIGLVNKLRAYALQDGGPADDTAQDGRAAMDTLDANRALGYGADERSFAASATMLRRLGITRVRLLTNNPQKVAGLAAHGIDVTDRLSHAIAPNGVNDAYLETKARRFGHLLGGLHQ